ncbi:ADP-ribosylation factor-like protein 14 [Trichosurus vulpecula]|uniref:ADP-ribosylation factor-like protein 14 n=1 Tax=Trichosurus vulpecula TaxID=9337 RepID=UPI00186B3099|nr:ADP-ribosylation factor-like protein 14 [Trichosurus vulpecula]
MGMCKPSKVKQARVLLLGLDFSGKSTILYKLKHAKDFMTLPTIGFNVEMLEIEKNIHLTVWDVGGQLHMRSFWGHYCEDTDVLVYVVDSTDWRHLEDSRREFECLLKNEHIRRVPVVLLANKQDLPGAFTAEDITRKFKMKKNCGDRDWYVQPCCATSGDGLTEGFHKVMEFIKSYRKSAEATLAFFKQNQNYTGNPRTW